MKSSLSNYYKYLARSKRNAPVISFDELIDSEDEICLQDIINRPDERMLQFETDLLLHVLACRLPRREMRIIRMKVRGDRMHDIAKQEQMTSRDINKALQSSYPTVISVLWGSYSS